MNTIRLLVKDLRLYLREAQAVGTTTPSGKPAPAAAARHPAGIKGGEHSGGRWVVIEPRPVRYGHDT